MTSPFPLSGTGKERWRVPLPGRHAGAVAVAADGTCFVSTEGGVVALNGPEIRWSVDTDAFGVLLDGDLLVTVGAEGIRVREQRTGTVVSTIAMRPTSILMPMPGDLLAFVTFEDLRRRRLRATTLTGETRWAMEVPAVAWPLVWHDIVYIAERTEVRAYDHTASPLWTFELMGELHGSLVGLPDGNVLVPVLGDDHIGYLALDPAGEAREMPAHLPPHDRVVPLADGLLVLPGWPERDDLGESYPTVAIVDSGDGSVVQHHRLPADIRGIAAGANGLIAVAASPDWEYWVKYHGWPGFDLREHCQVLFLDKDGPRGTWTAGRPITGPIAIDANGDLLVPVSRELVCVG